MKIASTLSSEERDELATAILDLMDFTDESAEEPYVLTPEDHDAVRISREQAAGGEFASESEMDALWRKYILREFAMLQRRATI